MGALQAKFYQLTANLSNFLCISQIDLICNLKGPNANVPSTKVLVVINLEYHNGDFQVYLGALTQNTSQSHHALDPPRLSGSRCGQ